jgi:hypothetical protein
MNTRQPRWMRGKGTTVSGGGWPDAGADWGVAPAMVQWVRTKTMTNKSTNSVQATDIFR